MFTDATAQELREKGGRHKDLQKKKTQRKREEEQPETAKNANGMSRGSQRRPRLQIPNEKRGFLLDLFLWRLY